MDNIGVWSRDKSLTKEQIKNRQALFAQYQKEYNENKDMDFFWEKLYPLIHDAVKSAVIRMNGQLGFIPNYQEKVDIADELLINRYAKKPDYNFASLSSLAYYASLYASRLKTTIELDKEDSYERIIEETLLRENEHITNITEPFYEQNFDDCQDIEEFY